MADTMELADEQAYFDRAWERREHVRHNAESAHGEGNRHDVIAYVQQNKDYAAQLAPPEVEVSHGSIALEDGEVVYVGRNSIWDESRDVLVVNWRTKIGELFERATVQDPCGVSRKRTFRTDENRILDFDDLVFAELATKVAELSELELSGVDDALLADLDTKRTGAMRDIVRTIQASQSGLIRHPANALLVIQGGPGTGKSAVALHRASWLLFNEQGLNPERMLVVGPNETFTNYIKHVLPGLGDVDIPHANLRHLGPQKSSRREEAPDTARLKGEARMAGLLERALHLRIRFAGKDAELVIGQGVPKVAIRRSEVEAKIDSLRSMATYNAGRAAMRTWLTERAANPGSSTSSFRRPAEVDAQAIDTALDRIWPPLTPQQFIRDLLGSQARLQEAAGDAFTAGDISRLHRQASPNLASESWSDSDVALLDEAEARIRGSVETFNHIIVDEAQDLSPMQLRSLRRRSVNGRYTIVGDIAQSTGPWSRDSWEEVIAGLEKGAPVVTEVLDYGYRVPSEIYDIAARLLPRIALGLEPIRVVRGAPEAPRFIRDNGDHDVSEEVVMAIQEHASKGRFIGVIATSADKDMVADELKRQDIDFADADQGALGSSVNLISATEAKGLEFDAVVVVEPSAIAGTSEEGLRLLYIALTRATKYLTVVHAHAFQPLDLEGVEPVVEDDPSFMKTLLGQSATEHARRPTPYGSDREPAGAPSSVSPSTRREADAEPSRLIVSAASAIVDDIRDGVPPAKWSALLAEVRQQLELRED